MFGAKCCITCISLWWVQFYLQLSVGAVVSESVTQRTWINWWKEQKGGSALGEMLQSPQSWRLSAQWTLYILIKHLTVSTGLLHRDVNTPCNSLLNDSLLTVIRYHTLKFCWIKFDSLRCIPLEINDNNNDKKLNLAFRIFWTFISCNFISMPINAAYVEEIQSILLKLFFI